MMITEINRICKKFIADCRLPIADFTIEKRKSKTANIIILVLFLPGLVTAAGQQPASARDFSNKYFKIQVVDRQTGRGVPLVELRSTNNTRYFTDSNGIVAYFEPGLMDAEVFFFVESHGYEFPKDGFGISGTRLKTSPGGSAIIKIDRLNVAERLYRVTGQGIYRDSILTGSPVPLKNPVLNGQVMGQDSVFTCIYHGRLFWMWGDTARPSYPLGNFAMSGAVSDLPGQGGLDPSVGVDLEYYVGEDGFSRPMCPLKEPGLVWLDGLLTVRDPQGNERMVAKFARLKGLGEVLEHGLVVFNDATETFEPLVRGGMEFLPYRNTGHAFGVEVNGRLYYYFTSPSPMGARLRVRAQWNDVIDPNRYEALTALVSSPSDDDNARTDLGEPKTACRWITFAELIASRSATKAAVIEALEQEAKDVRIYDVETGQAVLPHNGTVYFNAYRQRWIGIFVQQFGGPSNLGEVWYAEADTPVGPWAYARKIITHNKYSFYNPKQHPFFDKEDGRVIFFEGTYSFTFSGPLENATPRYDYNQIMYCLNLDDPRLALLVAVYQIKDKEDQREYMLRDGVEKANKWDSVESIPFYAVEPKRAHTDFVPIFADKVRTFKLTAERPNPSTEPLFYALPSSDEPESENSCIVPLYEYYHTDTEQRIYSTKPALEEKGWSRTENILCRVWKTPPAPHLLDSKAKPCNIH
jgi:hypothetical protein